jgi:hypothetical protein
MSITRTSTYAAFGNKEDPLRKALEHYTERSASHATRARRESIARQVTTAFLDAPRLANPPDALASKGPFSSRWPTWPREAGHPPDTPIFGKRGPRPLHHADRHTSAPIGTKVLSLILHRSVLKLTSSFRRSSATKKTRHGPRTEDNDA